MSKNALAIQVIIVFLIFFAGSACPVEQTATGTQENSNKELRTGESSQQRGFCEDREPGFESNFFYDLERFLARRFPDALEGWRQSQYWKKPLLGALLYRETLPVDIIDHDREFLIKAELPGVAKEDVHITISENVVTIEADACTKGDEEKGEYYRREISRGTYRRTLILPAQVKESEAEASLEDGVLKLTIPKMEKTEHFTIEVK